MKKEQFNGMTNPSNRTQLAAKNTTINIIFKLVSMIASFVIKTVMIKNMGLQYTGVSSLFTDILTLLSLAELGIGTAITYSLYKPLSQKDYKKIASYMNFYKKAYSMIGVTVFIVGLLFIPVLPFLVTDVPDIRESITLIYFLYLVNTSLSYFLIYKSSLLIANQENYKVSYIQSIATISKVIIQTLILIKFMNFYLFLITDIIITLIQNLIISNKADHEFKEIKKYRNLTIDEIEKKKMFNNIAALAMYQISGVVINSTDSIIISAFLGTGVVAFISNYRLIVRSVDGFIVQITSSLTPSIGNYVASDNVNNNQELIFRKISFINFIITLISSMVLLFFTNNFIAMWLGEKYVLHDSVLILFILDYIIVNLIRPVATFRNANGLFVQGKWRPVIMAIINIFLSLILVKKIGVPGVLLGTIISRIVTQTWFDPYVLYKHAFEEPIKKYINILKKYIISFVSSIIFIKILINLALRYIKGEIIVSATIIIVSTLIPIIIILVLYKGTNELSFFINILKKFLKRITNKI